MRDVHACLIKPARLMPPRPSPEGSRGRAPPLGQHEPPDLVWLAADRDGATCPGLCCWAFVFCPTDGPVLAVSLSWQGGLPAKTIEDLSLAYLWYLTRSLLHDYIFCWILY
jgi:hypothetical protein